MLKISSHHYGKSPSQLLIITPDVATRTKSNVLLIELNQIENLIERYGSIKFGNQHNRILLTKKNKEVIEPRRTLIGICIYHVILGSRRANAHLLVKFNASTSQREGLNGPGVTDRRKTVKNFVDSRKKFKNFNR